MWSLIVDSELFSCCEAAQKVPVAAIARRARRCFSSTLAQLFAMSVFYEENACCFGHSRWEHLRHGGCHDTGHLRRAVPRRGLLRRRLPAPGRRATHALAVAPRAALSSARSLDFIIEA